MLVAINNLHSIFLYVLMAPCATSFSDGKAWAGIVFMNELECERLAAVLLGVVVTFSTMSWLRNAIDDSYFYVIAWRPRRRSGTNGWAHGFTCSNSTSLIGMDGWCSNMNARIIIILRIWLLARHFARVLTNFFNAWSSSSMNAFVSTSPPYLYLTSLVISYSRLWFE